MKRFKKLISITLCILAFTTIFATNAFAAATDNNCDFNFRIQGSVDNAQDPNGRFRGTTKNNHSWKVQLTSSGEGEKTITKFWIENKNGTNASSAYNIKQGNPAEYKYSDEELEKMITKRITEMSNGKIFTVLVVDHSYGVLE